MRIVLLIAILAPRNLKMVPTGTQNIVEALIVWLREQVATNLGPKGEFLCPLIVTLFLFLIVANWLGLVPTMASPTNDLNTTFGLALLIVLIVHVLGLYMKGMHYVKHFFQPFPIFVVINVIEEVAKPITLAFRLFGNILAGEILIIILLMLAKWAILPSVAWLAFSLFIGGVQAFIFTSLSLAYLANAVKDSEE
jgi:F-type H+-transporting ATPase subunit a